MIQKIKEYLENRDNYQESDLLLIERIPFILDTIIKAEEDVNVNGIFVYNNKNEMRKNPALEIYVIYLNKLRETLIALGISPKERRKLENELREMLAQNDGFDD